MSNKILKHQKDRRTYPDSLGHKAKRKSIWGVTLLYSAMACLLGVGGETLWAAHATKLNKSQEEGQSPQGQTHEESAGDVAAPALSTDLQNLLEGHEAALGFSGHFDVPLKEVEQLYVQFNFLPLWITELKKTSCKDQILELIKHTGEEGLEEQDYAWIEKDFQKFIDQSQDPSLSPEEQKKALLKADILLTQALIQYISDVRGERLSPKKIDKELFLEDVKIDEVSLLIDLLKKDSATCAWLKELPPQHPQYQMLKKALQLYKEKASQDKDLPVFLPGATLKKGMQDPRVLTLWKILQARGFLPAASIPSNLFDEVLENAVKAFQAQNNLKPDGIAGANTQNLLSKNTQDTINQIIVTMERWRWMPKDLGNKYIMINIPEFQARTYENSALVFCMPIIVGKSYRETPVFASKIINVIFNPSWNVPPLIAVADKLPDIQKKGPDFLIQKGFHVYRDGTEVDPRTINWKNVSRSNFNYHFRQDPGDKNALGRIRFTIVNPFSVYMHGTPEQKLFDKEKRAFSSGCIRLENPIKMAAFVFEDSKKWSDEAIQAEINEKKTQTIPLKNPVSVYLSYFTIFEKENGQLAFFEDVYGQDKEILKALKSRRSRAP